MTEAAGVEVLHAHVPSEGAQAVIDTAISSVDPHELTPGFVGGVMVPAGAKYHEIDLSSYLPEPTRKRGTVHVHDAASLIAYAAGHATPATRLFADVYARTLVLVLNGHADDAAGWGDHKAQLVLKHTPEWSAWAALDGKLVAQTDFAEHIEDRLDDIQSPPGADLLELAQTFQAKTGVEFASAIVLESGQRQLTYKETIDARAGQAGQVVIPKEFELGLRPFEGGDAYKVVARLRYRINGGHLTIGYQLTRVEDVLRSAVNDVIEQVAEATGLGVLRGVPLTGA